MEVFRSEEASLESSKVSIEALFRGEEASLESSKVSIETLDPILSVIGHPCLETT